MTSERGQGPEQLPPRGAAPAGEPRPRETVGRPGGGPGFVVLPAVDVLGDEAVRLEQGDFARVGVRAGSPVELVERFAAAGPALIHVVDLGGAREGRIRPELVARLARAAAPVPIQASGGIRSVEDALTLLEAGAGRVIVGTAAFSEPDALDRFVAALGNRLVVAVDSRGGRLAVAGWEREGGLSVLEAAALCADAGVPRLHCTAVERDGTLSGPDLQLLAAVRDRSGLPILAAGGIRSLDDLDRLARLGLEGAVVGRALLDGSIPLAAVAARDGS